MQLRTIGVISYPIQNAAHLHVGRRKISGDRHDGRPIEDDMDIAGGGEGSDRRHAKSVRSYTHRCKSEKYLSTELFQVSQLLVLRRQKSGSRLARVKVNTQN